MIYVKERDQLCEVLEENHRYSHFTKKLIGWYKKIVCAVTIKESGLCVLPYENWERTKRLKLFCIKKVLQKIGKPIVLSRFLTQQPSIIKMLDQLEVTRYKGDTLVTYMIPDILLYICKCAKQEIGKQEVTILLQKVDSEKAKLIVELARYVKRIHLVGDALGQFRKIEKQLEEQFGMACQMSNNKRKSLAKASIILNLDMPNEIFHKFILNPNAIVIDLHQKIDKLSPYFAGIHIRDYEIHYEIKENWEKAFEHKAMYEAKIQSKSYEQIRKQMEEDKVQITKIIGEKGEIHPSEYYRIFSILFEVKNKKTLDKT